MSEYLLWSNRPGRADRKPLLRDINDAVDNAVSGNLQRWPTEKRLENMEIHSILMAVRGWKGKGT